MSWLGKEAARTGWRAGSKEQGAREGWQQVMRKCRQDKAGPPNGDPQRAVASKWTERASLSEACLRQTELGGPLSTSSCCGPGSGGIGGEVAEGRGWSKMQTRGLGDKKGVRPGSGLSGPFTQLLPTLRQQQEAGIGSRLSLSKHRASRRAYDLHMVDATGAAHAGRRIGNQRDWIVIARPRPSGSSGDQMSSVGRGHGRAYRGHAQRTGRCLSGLQHLQERP